MKNLTTCLCLSLLFGMTMSLSAQQKDWAKFSRYAEANKEVTVSPQVVFMGNSITEGWVREDPAFFTANNYAGRGISGQTTSEMLVRFRPDVIDLHPQIVVILAGTNDIAQNNGYISHKHILGNIISMVELAKANQITPILCSVLPATRFGWRPEIEPAKLIVELNEMIKAYAEQNGLLYVDYYSSLTDEKGGLPTQYATDGVHPNLEAYRIMERLVQEALKKVIR
ncbi:SGNH/GDSL hydrolase family protein [Parabacteroides sp. OttesenSCG-928-B22]|nr:SGNH/GDSL hydrolase family protein [Parabacteroides sp. OttesenSCG-928-B22]